MPAFAMASTSIMSLCLTPQGLVSADHLTSPANHLTEVSRRNVIPGTNDAKLIWTAGEKVSFDGPARATEA